MSPSTTASTGSQANPSPTSTLTAPQVVSTAPTNPKMGEYFQEPGSSEWTLKCGGKPDMTWTNIDPTSKLMYRSPMCNRYAYSKDKAFKRRSGGLSAKFAKGDGVTDFCTKFGNYLQEHGMDTIAYALNPNDPTEMVFLPENMSSAISTSPK